MLLAIVLFSIHSVAKLGMVPLARERMAPPGASEPRVELPAMVELLIRSQPASCRMAPPPAPLSQVRPPVMVRFSRATPSAVVTWKARRLSNPPPKVEASKSPSALASMVTPEPTIRTEESMTSSPEVRWIVPPARLVSKVIVSRCAVVPSRDSALRRLPGPLSSRVLTTKVTPLEPDSQFPKKVSRFRPV